MPAVFIIDQDGIIQFADVDADYTTRAEPQDIIDALKKL
jgi:peroxiredoxin